MAGNSATTASLRDVIEDIRGTADTETADREAVLKLQIAHCDERLSRLIDRLIDVVIDKDVYESKKFEILKERRTLLDQLETLGSEPSRADRILQDLELTNTAYIQYKTGIDAEKRDMVLETTSNLAGVSNYPAITLKSPFQELAEWRKSKHCALPRSRT